MRTYVDRRHAIIASSLIALIALSAVFATVTYEIFGAPVAELSRADDASIEELAAEPETEVLGEQQTNDQDTTDVARGSNEGIDGNEAEKTNDATTIGAAATTTGAAAVDSGQGQPATVAVTNATIGDLVWVDLDGNGLQDLGEPGAPGVVVELLDSTESVSATTITDSLGHYLFEVPPGSYTLRFAIDADSVTVRNGGDDLLDSDIGLGGVTDSVVVGAGETDLSKDAGIVPNAASISVETRVNGVDTDGGPGPSLIAGDTVTFTYLVENNGNTKLTELAVSDDRVGVVGCATTELSPFESVLCTVTANVTEGEYESLTSVSAIPVDPAGDPLNRVSANDRAHYVGLPKFAPLGQFNLEVSTNGDDADVAPGAELIVGEEVRFLYTATNTGNLDLIDLAVVDDQLGDICTIPSLPVGEERDCSAIAEVAAGQYRNSGTATATVVDRNGATSRQTVESSDLSHHVGLAPVVETVYPCPTTVEGPRLQRNNDGLLEWDSGLVAAPGSTIEITTSEPGASPGQSNEQVYVQVGDELFGPTPNEHTTTTFTVTEGGLVKVVHYSVIETTSFGSNSVNFTLCGSGLTPVK